MERSVRNPSGSSLAVEQTGEDSVADSDPFEASIPCVSVTLQFQAKSVSTETNQPPTGRRGARHAACSVNLSEVDGVLDDLAASPAGYFVCKLHRLLRRLDARKEAAERAEGADRRSEAHGAEHDPDTAATNACADVDAFGCRVFGTLLDVSDFLWRVGELYLVIQPLPPSHTHETPPSPTGQGGRTPAAPAASQRRVSFSSVPESESGDTSPGDSSDAEPRYVTFSLKEVLDRPTPGKRVAATSGKVREFDNEVQLDPGDDGTLLWVRLRLEEFRIPYGSCRGHPALPPPESGDAFLLSLSLVEDRSLHALVAPGETQRGRQQLGGSAAGQEAFASDPPRVSLRLGGVRRACLLTEQPGVGCAHTRVREEVAAPCRFALVLVGSWEEALLYLKGLASSWIQLEAPREEKISQSDKVAGGRLPGPRRSAHARLTELPIDFSPLATRVAQHLAMLHDEDAFPPGTAASPALASTNCLSALLHSANHPRQPRRVSVQAQLLFLVFRNRESSSDRGEGLTAWPPPALDTHPEPPSLAPSKHEEEEGGEEEGGDKCARVDLASPPSSSRSPWREPGSRHATAEASPEDEKENVTSQSQQRSVEAAPLSPRAGTTIEEGEKFASARAEGARASAPEEEKQAWKLLPEVQTEKETPVEMLLLSQCEPEMSAALNSRESLDAGFPPAPGSLRRSSFSTSGISRPQSAGHLQALWRLSVDLVSIQLRAGFPESRRAVYVHYSYAPFGPQHSFSTEPPVDCSSGETVPLSEGFCAYTLTASPARLFESLRTTPLEFVVASSSSSSGAAGLGKETVGSAVVDLGLLTQTPLHRHCQAPHDYQAYSAVLPIAQAHGETVGHLHVQLYLEHLRVSPSLPARASAPANAEWRALATRGASPTAKNEKNGLSFSVAYEVELWKRAEKAKFLAELKTRAVEERERFLEDVRRVETAKNEEIRAKQEALQILQMQLKQMAQQLQQKALDLQSREIDLRSERERCLQLAARTSDEMTGATRRLREEKEHAVQLEKQKSHMLHRQNEELQAEVARLRTRLDFLEEENCELRQQLTSGPTAQLQSDLKLKLYQVADLESRLAAVTASRDYFVESCAALLEKLHSVKETTGVSPHWETNVETQMSSLRSEIGSLRLALLQSQTKTRSTPTTESSLPSALPSSLLPHHASTVLEKRLPSLPPSGDPSTSPRSRVLAAAAPSALSAAASSTASRESELPPAEKENSALTPRVPPVPHTEPLRTETPAGEKETLAGEKETLGRARETQRGLLRETEKGEEIERKVTAIESELERLLTTSSYREEDAAVQALRGKIEKLRALKRFL
ncbi:UNVERIFIED_CONTAM: hypothetical protein HHA_285210 [Hammondia hammondi]|eukprot:XP_008884201.1 hypothetical protein HHA_285210 [Hammondia hammondi]